MYIFLNYTFIKYIFCRFGGIFFIVQQEMERHLKIDFSLSPARQRIPGNSLVVQSSSVSILSVESHLRVLFGFSSLNFQSRVLSCFQLRLIMARATCSFSHANSPCEIKFTKHLFHRIFPL